MNYQKAKEAIVSERDLVLFRADRLYRRLTMENKELKEADLALRNAVMDLRSDEEIDSLLKARAKLIESLGYSLDDVFPPPRCKKCGDTGLYGGRYCDCVKKRLMESGTDFVIPEFSFDDSDLSVFGSERPTMEKCYGVMRIFGEKFPETKNLNILICGAVGTGKTSLAAALANAVNNKGYSVAFVTAFRFNDICLRYHTTFTPDKEDLFAPLTDADLLVIDDLGTEPVYRNVTSEYLYNIINERIVSKKHTVITTNLSPGDISRRYGERISSRLFDKRICLPMGLSGKDLRK